MFAGRLILLACTLCRKGDMKVEKIRLNPECISCLLKKHLNCYPESADKNKKIEYMQKVLGLTASAPKEMSAPELLSQINQVKLSMFGIKENFADIKHYFNSLMLKFEKDITKNIYASKDPLKMALCYAMTGNYIDFGAMDSVDESKLKEFIDNVSEDMISDDIYDEFKNELGITNSIVYLTDNCGEIVFDKIFISVIRELFPEISVTAMVRGENILNDATITDAREVGLDKIAAVEENGTDIAGTCLHRLPDKARNIIVNADMVISKGQGNFETLQMCGENIYYIFLCKCRMFAQRFNVPLYSGMLIKERK